MQNLCLYPWSLFLVPGTEKASRDRGCGRSAWQIFVGFRYEKISKNITFHARAANPTTDRTLQTLPRRQLPEHPLK